MNRIAARVLPPEYQLDIDFPTAVGAAAEAPVLVRQVLLPTRVRLAMRVADGESAQFRVVAGLEVFPGIEIPAAAVAGYLVQLDDTQAGMALRLIPMTAQRLVLLVGLALVCVVLMRLRVWLGVWALAGLVLWAAVHTAIMLRTIDALLHRTFGAAFPYKRGR